jgi:YVTN family beta-propeller protein
MMKTLLFILITAVLTFSSFNCTRKTETDTNKSPLPSTYDKLSNEYPRMGESGYVYVSHITRSFVSVIDPNSCKVIGMIPGDSGTCSITFTPSYSKGYIANYFSNTVTVFDAKTNKVIKNIEAGEHPTNTAVSNDGNYLFVSHESSQGIWVISTSDNKLVKKFPIGTGELVSYKNGELFYQPQIFIPQVIILDPQKLEITKYIDVGGRPLQLVFSPDYKYAYVSNYDLNEVEKIDTDKDSVISRIPGMFHARGIAVSPDGKFLYVTDVISRKVYAVDTENEKIVKEILVYNMPTSLAVSPDGKFIFVSNQGSGYICIFDIKTNEKIKDIEVADNPITVQVF